VRRTLIHTVRVQDWWLSVLNRSPIQIPEPDLRMPLQELERWYGTSHQALATYGDHLTEALLATEVAVFNPWEKRENRWPGWQLLAHLLNHSGHHRAEAGLMLEALGHSPGDLDFIFFLRDAPG